MRAALAAIFALLFTLGSGAQSADAPAMPYVDWGACPFEGCEYRDWTAGTDVPALEYPSQTWMADSFGADRLKTLFRVTKGEIVTAMSGVVVITAPGRVRLLTPIELPLEAPGFPRQRQETITAAPGEVVYLLTYHGEAFFTGWFNGRLVGVSAENFGDPADVRFVRCAATCNGQILERVKSVWWVKIRNSKGQIGWTNRPEVFNGKDRYGP